MCDENVTALPASEQTKLLSSWVTQMFVQLGLKLIVGFIISWSTKNELLRTYNEQNIEMPSFQHKYNWLHSPECECECDILYNNIEHCHGSVKLELIFQFSIVV